jgi:hypothetical protein
MSGIALPRLALACWDYAWLTRNDARQGPYRQLPACLDALVERGYNGLRIDAFPHLIAARSDGVVIDRFDVLPPHRAPVQVQPRRGLIELAQQARNRGIRLWLGSRFLADTQSRRSFVRRPQDFIDVWSQTLDLLKREGLLDTVVAVDFCHHFPLPQAAYGASRHIFRSHPLNKLAQFGIWSRATEQRAEQYLLEVPRSLRALFPGIAFGVSTGAASDRHLRALDTSELDFIDGHLWLNDDPAYAVASGGLIKGAGNRLAARLQNRVAGMVWERGRDQWQRHLGDRIRELHDFARVRRMSPAIGAGFVRLPSEKEADWGWVREVCDFAVEQALEQGVLALCPAVQARPHGEGLWDDVSWQQAINQRILGR